MRARVVSLTAAGSHSRPAASVTRTPTARPTFRPTPSLLLGSSAAASPAPATPTFSSSAHPTQRQAIIPAAVSRGPAHLNFLETNQPGTRPVAKRPNLVIHPGGAQYRHQLAKGVRELHGVILPEWMQEIYEHLESDELQQKLELARNNTGITGRRDCDDFPYKVEILERLHQLPMLSDTVCDVDRERIQTENYEPADGPHQDHHPYKFRAVFRFPADGRSTTDIDFHAGEDKRLVASLAILPGQGYIISDKIGREGSGNIFTHNVPPGHDVISLVINCDGTLEFS